MPLARPDARRAKRQREEFADCTVTDSRKLVSYTQASGFVSPDEGGALLAAMDAMRPYDVRVRSEFFNAYFHALEVVSAPDKAGARDAVLRFGNVLLQDMANGALTTPVPVARDSDGHIPLPAAPSSFFVDVAGEMLTPQRLEPVARRIREAIAATWIKPGGEGVGVRGETGPAAVEVARYRTEVRRLIEMDDRSDDHENRLEFLDPASSSGAAVLRGFESATALIEEVDPEQAEELSILTEYVVPLQGDQFVAGSSLNLFGATFLRVEPQWSELSYADHLVHEASHQLIHAAQEMEPLLLNRDQVGAPSPIRSDPRPLYGSFHATFVFLRLTQFMRGVLSSPALSRFHAEAQIRFNRHLLGVLQGLQVLVDHGEFSAAGQAELDSWIATARELRAFQGPPDPDLCVKLDWDYEPPRDLALPLIAV